MASVSNTPNDLAVDRRGRIWFTNPWNAGNIDPSEREELDNRSVLRADPQSDGSYTVARVTFDTTMPNGILVSIDGSTLYVAESNSDDITGDRELRAYPINDDGSLGPYTVLHTFGKDASTRCFRGTPGHRRHVLGHRWQHRGDGRVAPGRARALALRFFPRGPGAGNPSGGLPAPHQLLFRRARYDNPVCHVRRRALLQS